MLTLFVYTPGASAGVIGVVIIALGFGMLRWSRRQHCSYHNKELGEIVPSLKYRKRNIGVETASVDSFEDVSVSSVFTGYPSPVSNRVDDRVNHPSRYSSQSRRCYFLLPIELPGCR